MKAAIISEKGRRSQMEDAHFLDLDFGEKKWIFGGIYDGHGGKYAAEYTAKNLAKLFLERIERGFSPQQAFKECYQKISDQLKEQDSGTTAVNFFIKPEEKKIFTANVGDTRVLVIGKNFSQLTIDHRLDDPAERQRIKENGGEINYPYVLRGNRGLMPTRTIGDHYFKPVGVIAIPSVNEYEILEEDLWLIAACDGLFDVMKNEEVVEITRKSTEVEELAENLKQEVLFKRQGSDNLSIIVLDLTE